MTPNNLKALLATIERGWNAAKEVLDNVDTSMIYEPEFDRIDFDKGRQVYAALLQHMERMEKALEFYADGDSYYIDKLFGGSAVGRDKGERAREALAPTGQPAIGDGGQGAG